MPTKDLKSKKLISLPQALLAPIVDPLGAITKLIDQPGGPPHTFSLLFLFIAICLAPPLFYTSFDGTKLVDRVYLFSVANTSFFCGLLTLVLVLFSTRAISSHSSLKDAFAVLVYSTTPATLFMLLIISGSYLLNGDLGVVRSLAAGAESGENILAQLVHYGLRGVAVITFINLTNGFSVILRSSRIIGGILACVTVLLLLGSFIIALRINEIFNPYTSSLVIKFFSNFL
jgi:hypothetical protein